MTIETLELDELQRRDVCRVVEENVPAYSRANAGEFLRAASSAAKQLHPRIQQWRLAVEGANAGLLRNLPIGSDLPRTPICKGVLDSQPMFADGVAATLSALFGDIYVFDAKCVQRHIHNIYPALEDENTQMGASSSELTWHVEDGFHDHRPSWIALLCLRGDPAVVTKVAGVNEMSLADRDLQQLQHDECCLRVDESFVEPLRDSRRYTTVLQRHGERCEIVFDPEYTVYRDDSQKALHARLSLAASRAQREVTLRSGEFLIINNRRAVHSRSSYTPKRDGTDRWIKRTLIVDDRVPVEWVSPGIARATSSV